MNKVNLIEALAVRLFEPEYRRLGKEVERLDKLNQEIRGHRTQGFMLAGQYYFPPDCAYRPQAGQPSLDFSLSFHGQVFLKDKAHVEDDKQLIKQIIHLLIKDCDSIEDVRDALPESLIELSSVLGMIPRTRETAYTISHDPRMMRQYEQLLEKIDFYVATRMIY